MMIGQPHGVPQGSNERWIHATLPRVRRLLPSLSSVSFPSDKRTRRRLISLSRHQFRKGKKIRRTENRCCYSTYRHLHLQPVATPVPPRPRPTPNRMGGAGNVSRDANTSVCEGGRAKAAGPNHSFMLTAAPATDGSAVAAPRFRNNSSGFSDYSPSPRPSLPHRERIRLARGPWPLARCSCSAPSAWSLRYITAVTTRGRVVSSDAGGGAICLFLACGLAVLWRRHGNSAWRPARLRWSSLSRPRGQCRAATDQRLILFYLLVGRTARHGIVCEMHGSVCPCV